MVKIIPKESDSILTIGSEDLSSVYSDGQQRDARTITTLIQQIPRSVISKHSRYSYQEITSRKWSPRETLHFYHMLQVVGTDFSMMANLQTRRSKKQLLNKYKKEEKNNPQKIYQILSNLQLSPLYLNLSCVQAFEP